MEFYVTMWRCFDPCKFVNYFELLIYCNIAMVFSHHSYTSDKMQVEPYLFCSRYLPPYIVYKFHDEEKHQSEGRTHGKTIKFLDKDVILLGTKKRGPLFEYLQGPKFKIEVHDRDSKVEDRCQFGVYGSHANDEGISSATTGECDKCM